MAPKDTHAIEVVKWILKNVNLTPYRKWQLEEYLVFMGATKPLQTATKE